MGRVFDMGKNLPKVKKHEGGLAHYLATNPDDMDGPVLTKDDWLDMLREWTPRPKEFDGLGIA